MFLYPKILSYSNNSDKIKHKIFMALYEKEEIEKFISTQEPIQQQICNNLRNLILECIPNSIEMIAHNALGYAPIKSYMERKLYIAPHKNWVNLGFFSGTDLYDPENLLEGTGKKMRHIKIKSIEQSKNPALRNLITLAWQTNIKNE